MHLPMFAITWLTFFLAAIVSFVVQVRLAGGGAGIVTFLRHCFPLEEWRGASARTDVLMYIVSKFTKGLYASFGTAVTVALAFGLQELLRHSFPGHRPLSCTWPMIVIFSLLVFLVLDFSSFYAHLLQHKIPLLWEMHKVHHSATFLNPATTERVHPFDYLFAFAFSALLVSIPIGIAGFLFDLSIPNSLILLANANAIGTIIVLDALKHSQFPISFGRFDGYLLSPHMHQLHHSASRRHWNKNFGNRLSVWDRVFGTAMIPRESEAFTYGTGDADEGRYNSLNGAFLFPIVKIRNMVLAGRGAHPPSPSIEHLSQGGTTPPD